MDFVIRDATEDDLPAAAHLAVCMVRFHHQLDPDRFMRPAPYEEGYQRFLRGQLFDPRSLVMVAEERDTGALIGYAYGRFEPMSWESLLDQAGWLHDLFVDEAHRRHGVALALVEAVVQRLREMGAPRVVLQVAERNPDAARLFSRMGFRPTMRELTMELPAS
jgi:ribosomal protein S18 acetylase RimI-like enzyme